MREIQKHTFKKMKYMLFGTGLGSVRLVKNCDQGLENAVFPSKRSQFFTIRIDPKPVNRVLVLKSV